MQKLFLCPKSSFALNVTCIISLYPFLAVDPGFECQWWECSLLCWSKFHPPAVYLDESQDKLRNDPTVGSQLANIDNKVLSRWCIRRESPFLRMYYDDTLVFSPSPLLNYQRKHAWVIFIFCHNLCNLLKLIALVGRILHLFLHPHETLGSLLQTPQMFCLFVSQLLVGVFHSFPEHS